MFCAQDICGHVVLSSSTGHATVPLFAPDARTFGIFIQLSGEVEKKKRQSEHARTTHISYERNGVETHCAVETQSDR